MWYRVAICIALLVGWFVLVNDASGSSSRVSRVIDGDTFVLSSGERVRIIGVNAPEIKSNDCYAFEAKKALSDMISGKSVRLVSDRGARDVYGRRLAYVMLGDVDVGVWLAEHGFVRYMFVAPNFARKRVIMSSVYDAINHDRGMWGVC